MSLQVGLVSGLHAFVRSGLLGLCAAFVRQCRSAAPVQIIVGLRDLASKIHEKLGVSNLGPSSSAQKMQVKNQEYVRQTGVPEPHRSPLI